MQILADVFYSFDKFRRMSHAPLCHSTWLINLIKVCLLTSCSVANWTPAQTIEYCCDKIIISDRQIDIFEVILNYDMTMCLFLCIYTPYYPSRCSLYLVAVSL